MHQSSLENMAAFRKEYLAGRENERLEILDLGSCDVNGSYRQFFASPNWRYIGVDMAPGKNVDVVLSDTYDWKEFGSSSIDVLVSGQVFEHIEYFWLTMLEIKRVLKPGGLCCIIAPSGGYEHRYPVDCWRFYPDGVSALARYAGLEVLKAETKWEGGSYTDDSTLWKDTVLVCRKPADAGEKGKDSKTEYREGMSAEKKEKKEGSTRFNPLDYSGSLLQEPKRLTDVVSWHEHIPFAFVLMEMLRPKVFVELGTHKGDSYLAFCQAVNTLGLDTRCFAVDTWKGEEHAGLYGNAVLEELKAFHDPLYGRFSILIQSTFDGALAGFGDGTVDLLHIDGLHTYEAVKHDFETWLPKVSGRGVVLFHDISVRERDFGVWRFWDEVKERYPHFEFHHGNGLGVLCMGKDSNGPLSELLEASKAGAKKIQDFFFAYGHSRAQPAALRARYEGLLAEKDGQIQEKERQIQEKERQIQEKERQIQAFLNSYSWKITAPLRAVFKMNNFFSLITIKNLKASLVTIRTHGPMVFLNQLRQALLQKKYGYSKECIYDLWINKNEPQIADLRGQKEQRFDYAPKISLVLRITDQNKDKLKTTISSIQAQTYSFWELFVVSGGSATGIGRVVGSYFKNDSRIMFGHLSEADAISHAEGEFISFIKQGDSLAVFALHDVVSALNKNQDADLIYSDEDKIDSTGKRSEPFFKPDWSPDYFLSCNYINHLAVIRKSLVKDMGSEYDLLLRITESAKRIVHVPKVLYHSYAADTDPSKDKNHEERNAIASALRRSGLQAEVLETQYKGFYRVKYRILRPEKVSIIIPTKDKVEVLKKCVDSVLSKTTYNNYEIIIVDNGSVEARTFEYYKTIESDARVRVLKYEAPFNYSKMNNYAVKRSTGYYLLFLNNDTEVISPDWIESMIEFAQRKTTGVVGAKLFFSNDTIQHAGIIIGVGGMAGHSHRFLPRDIAGYGGRVISIQNLSAVTGACMMVRKEVFEEVGGFDENLAVAYNDVELCVRIKEKGFFVVYTPFAELYHYECYTRGYDDTAEKQRRCKKEYDYFKSKWGPSFTNGDPFYSPNLTLVYEDFSIKI